MVHAIWGLPHLGILTEDPLAKAKTLYSFGVSFKGDQKPDPQKRTGLGAGGRESLPLRVYTSEPQKPKWSINIWKDVGYQGNTK